LRPIKFGGPGSFTREQPLINTLTRATNPRWGSRRGSLGEPYNLCGETKSPGTPLVGGPNWTPRGWPQKRGCKLSGAFLKGGISQYTLPKKTRAALLLFWFSPKKGPRQSGSTHHLFNHVVCATPRNFFLGFVSVQHQRRASFFTHHKGGNSSHAAIWHWCWTLYIPV